MGGLRKVFSNTTFILVFRKNSKDLNEMPQLVFNHLDLHYIPKYDLGELNQSKIGYLEFANKG